MANEMEKVTINLGVVELAQIDVLVEQGIYSNRTDVIRTAVRNELKLHEERFERIVNSKASTRSGSMWGLGIFSVSRKELEDNYAENGNRPCKISVIGMLRIAKDVTPEIFGRTVESVSVRGKIVASPEVREMIKEMP